MKSDNILLSFSGEFFNLDECDDGVGEDASSGQHSGDGSRARAHLQNQYKSSACWEAEH